jgi:hypothetical protein
MAVEISILSGTRQGARIVLDGKQFRVGTESDCEVFFDPQQDPAAKDRAALLQLEDDGWHIRSTGIGELIINQQTVTGSRCLRSGDVVRLSAIGPDFCFRLVARGAETPKKPLDPRSIPAGPSPAVAARPESKPLEVAGASPTAAVASSPRPMVPTAPSPWTKWMLAGLAVCLVAAVLWRVFQPQPASQVTIQVSEKSPESTDGNGNIVTPDKKPSSPGPETPGPSPPKPSPPIAPPRPAPESPLVQLRDAVFLVEVEKAGRVWPFATCVAVGKETLLTSAREAMQLAAWRENEGFKLWAVNPTLGIKKEIHEIRLHGVFATLAEKPNDWIYFNLALLGVEGDLPMVAPLASNEELQELKEDSAVSCLGFTHDGKKTSAARQFELQWFQGSIFLVTAPEDLPGRPRLLHIEAKIPQNVYGSPILNEKGNVVGVYGAAAPPADQNASAVAVAMKDIHFASLVVPDAIRLWTEKRDEKMWVSPTALKAPSQPSSHEPDQVERTRNGGQ